VIAGARFALWLGVATFGATLFAAPAAEARRKKRRRAHAALASTTPSAQPSAVPPALRPDAARAYQASYDHEMAGRFADAIRDLSDLPAEEQESYLGRLRRGWLLYRAGRHGESVTAYRQAIAIEKGSVEARVGGLLPLIALKQWGDVEQGARAAIDLDPANYLAGIRLAFAVYNRGRYPEAEALYRRLLGRYPSDADARAGLGWALLKQGKQGEARQAFLAASRTAPRSPTVVEGLAAAGR
jgi:tetratricopeptide (TPR) repeat protein